MTLCSSGLEVAAGTVPGRAHVAAGRNCQDASAIWRGDDAGAPGAVVAVVCDGCGSGASSEVGARLGARLVAAAAGRGLVAGADPRDPAFWDGVRAVVLDRLSALAALLGGDRREAIADHLLFTVVAAALTPDGGAVAALGDGVVLLDGQLVELGPYPDNRPPYLAYALLGAPAAGTRLDLVATFAAGELAWLALGTDGAADLDRAAGAPLLAGLGDDDALFANPDALRRRLALLARDTRDPATGLPRASRLADDVTLLVVRRAPGGRP